jgi:hypothetical protein
MNCNTIRQGHHSQISFSRPGPKANASIGLLQDTDWILHRADALLFSEIGPFTQNFPFEIGRELKLRQNFTLPQWRARC